MNIEQPYSVNRYFLSNLLRVIEVYREICSVLLNVKAREELAPLRSIATHLKKEVSSFLTQTKHLSNSFWTNITEIEIVTLLSLFVLFVYWFIVFSVQCASHIHTSFCIVGGSRIGHVIHIIHFHLCFATLNLSSNHQYLVFCRNEFLFTSLAREF